MHMHAFTRAGGDPVGPLLGSHLLTKWQLDAVAVAVLVLVAAAYLTGVALAPIAIGHAVAAAPHACRSCSGSR